MRDSGQDAPTTRREGDVGTEFARLTLVLNLEYNSLVPADSRGRDSVKQHLALAIAGAARGEATRVKVLQVETLKVSALAYYNVYIIFTP